MQTTCHACTVVDNFVTVDARSATKSIQRGLVSCGKQLDDILKMGSPQGMTWRREYKERSAERF